uniref:E3 ubiquitin-protein ligase Topors n=1 Tax=Sander lucioperca TaxID=283035 RepID=A0A8C9X451_SANLU
MSAIKIALQQSQKKGRRKTSEAMSAEVSPDSKCPICLDIFNNISYLNVCLHKFCFRCIQEWSKNKAECPLCKQPFNSIYHSIKSDQDFKKYDLQPVDNGSFGTFGGVRFRYRTTLTGVHRQMRGRTSPPPDNGVMFEASANPPQQPQDRYIRRMMKRLAAKRRAASEGRAVNSVREQEMVNFRRELYRRGVRIRSVRDGGRSRDTSAEFFRRNPACLHRLIPWLKRELIVLYGAHGSLVNIVQHIIMSRITRYDMEDGAIQEELRPFLQGRTEHFLHEFISFAKSPFNMEAYDQHAAYDCPAPSSNEDSSSNSSVIAISEDEEDSVELDPPGDSTSTLSHSAWDDETPGPSYSTTAEQSRAECLSVLDLDSDSDSNVAHGGVNNEECLSYDSDDCVIINFIKPTAERTPELVQLSSDSDESASEDIKAVPLLPQHIRFSSLSPIASQSSDPSGAGQSENAETDHYHQLLKCDRNYKRRDCGYSYQSNRHYSQERNNSGMNYTENRSYYYSIRNYSDRHSCSRSHSRDSRRRDRGHSRSRTCSSSRSPSTKSRYHTNKPGGKRKYKTRHLEEASKNTLPHSNTNGDSPVLSTKHKKKSKEKHRKKSKDRSRKISRSLSVELVNEENSNERSKHHHKKKKKHKKKSKRHKSNERTEKHLPTVITIDSDSDSFCE